MVKCASTEMIVFQAQVCERQHAHEIARLKKAMSTLLREAGERTRKEVSACNLTLDLCNSVLAAHR